MLKLADNNIKNRYFEFLKFALPVLVSLLLLQNLFAYTGWSELISVISGCNINYLLLSFIFFFFAPFLSAWRWKILLTAAGTRITYKGALFCYLASLPVSKLSPSNSGDLVRAYYLKKDLPLPQGMGIVLFENLLDLAVLSVLAIFGGIKLGLAYPILAGLSIIGVIVIFYILARKAKERLYGKWRARVSALSDIIPALAKNPGPAISGVALTVLLWSSMLAFIKYALLSFGAYVPNSDIIAIQPIVIVLGLLPVTFSGVGVRESGMLALYSPSAGTAAVLSVGLLHSLLAIIILPLLCLPITLVAMKKI
jgi:hypothetical protein